MSTIESQYRMHHDIPQLILFDLDGTAMQSTSGSTLSSRLKAAIMSAPSNIKIAIATGRSWDHFWPVITDITARLEPCIISGGSQIVNCKTQEIVWQIDLTPQQVEVLNMVAATYHKPLSFNNGSRTIAQAGAIKDARPTIVYLLDILPAELDEIYGAVSQIPQLHAAITNAWGDTGAFALHITHESANKGTATRELLRILGLDKADAVAIGDGLNDIPMFNVVGRSLAVADSVVDGHETVAGTIGALADDGLAIYIETLQKAK